MSWNDLFTNKSLSDETVWSKEISLRDNRHDHGLEIVVTGTGSIAITPYTSISGRSWVSNGEKINGFEVTDGPDSDGKQILSLLVKPSEYIKFKFTATGDIILTSWFTQK